MVLVSSEVAVEVLESADHLMKLASILRFCPVLVLYLCMSATSTSRETEVDRKHDKKIRSTLDRLLLDDLTADTDFNLDVPRRGRSLQRDDTMFEKGLHEGEDIQFGQVEDPVEWISQRMVSVSKRIEDHDTGRTTQELQLRISRELEVMIERAQRQRKMPANPKQNRPQTALPDSVKQPVGRDQPQDRLRAQENTEQFDRPTTAGGVNMKEMEAWIQQFWGNLPSKMQEKMINSKAERFLPQYEELIIDYYRRLAEDEASQME